MRGSSTPTLLHLGGCTLHPLTSGRFYLAPSCFGLFHFPCKLLYPDKMAASSHHLIFSAPPSFPTATIYCPHRNSSSNPTSHNPRPTSPTSHALTYAPSIVPLILCCVCEPHHHQAKDIEDDAPKKLPKGPLLPPPPGHEALSDHLFGVLTRPLVRHWKSCW